MNTEERLTKFIGAYVTKTMAQELEEYAEDFGITKSEVIRRALYEHLDCWVRVESDKEV